MDEKKLKVFKEKSIEEQIDEILDYMGLIRKNLLGDRFKWLDAKFYNIETYSPERCPECGNLREKFFLMLQPGQDLFNAPDEPAALTDYKVFCLECTKKLDNKSRPEERDGSL